MIIGGKFPKWTPWWQTKPLLKQQERSVILIFTNGRTQKTTTPRGWANPPFLLFFDKFREKDGGAGGWGGRVKFKRDSFFGVLPSGTNFPRGKSTFFGFGETPTWRFKKGVASPYGPLGKPEGGGHCFPLLCWDFRWGPQMGRSFFWARWGPKRSYGWGEIMGGQRGEKRGGRFLKGQNEGPFSRPKNCKRASRPRPGETNGGPAPQWRNPKKRS